MPKQRIVAPYGTWRSPITADLIAAETVGLGQVSLDGDDIYWTESRPTEGGGFVLVRYAADGDHSEVTPLPSTSVPRSTSTVAVLSPPTKGS